MLRTLFQTFINSSVALSFLPASLAFKRAATNPAQTQTNVLRRILNKNKNSLFGTRHNFQQIRSVKEYQEKVPLSTYEDYEKFIETISKGAKKILTSGSITVLQPTSGSSGARKLIPYTRDLQYAFGTAVKPWIFALYLHFPALLTGRSYWQITPAYRESDGRGNPQVRVGFEKDSEYLGSFASFLFERVFAVPSIVQEIESMESFRYITALFLLSCRDLSLISCWSPSFLTLLLQYLEEHQGELLHDIKHGSITPPNPISAQLLRILKRKLRYDKIRIQELQKAFSLNSSSLYRSIWPKLAVISCWTEGYAQFLLPELKARFPDVLVQGKGLIATEGIVSFPLLKHSEGTVVAISSHFFEFLEQDSDKPFLVHELRGGKRYTVVLTNDGGLYRYRLGDIVEVCGFAGKVPLIKFIEREEQVSDFFGEKLHERYVRDAFSQLIQAGGIEASFSVVSCERAGNMHSYCLFIEAPATDDNVLRWLGKELEAALLGNFHYAYARKLGQLQSLRVFRIHQRGLETYVENLVSRGQREGNIKPRLLERSGGWLNVFSELARELSPPSRCSAAAA